MSSKRKSPPTKLQEGSGPSSAGSGAEMEAVAPHPRDYYKLSPSGIEPDTQPNLYKLSSGSSSSSSEVEDELSPPNKRKKDEDECSGYYQPNCMPKSVNSLQALLSLNQAGYLEDRTYESPTEVDKKALLHLNNNSTTLNHNNSNGGGKRSMDDVLKRLTSKMNSSTIREEHRPCSPSKFR